MVVSFHQLINEIDSPLVLQSEYRRIFCHRYMLVAYELLLYIMSRIIYWLYAFVTGSFFM